MSTLLGEPPDAAVGGHRPLEVGLDAAFEGARTVAAPTKTEEERSCGAAAVTLGIQPHFHTHLCGGSEAFANKTHNLAAAQGPKVIHDAMKLVGWNCCGMGKNLDKYTKIEYLDRFMNSTGAQITFVSEVRTSRYNSSHLNSHFNIADSYVVPSDGRSGGLWMLWSDEVCVSVKLSNHYMILALLVNKTTNVEFSLACLYGDPHHRDIRMI
jgi:hypothetical protein